METIESATITLAAAATVTVTPPAGEKWLLTHLNGPAACRYAIGALPVSGTGANAISGVPVRGLILTPTNYLGLRNNNSNTSEIVYSGVKL